MYMHFVNVNTFNCFEYFTVSKIARVYKQKADE